MKPPEPDQRPLFASLVVSNPSKAVKNRILPYSLVGHILAAGLLILVPILWSSPPPLHTDPLRVLLYNPPPPPPPPLPKGSALVKKPEPAHPVTPEKKPDETKLTVPDEHPKEEKLKPEDKKPQDQQAGVENGSEMGVPEGMEGGVEGGQVGGVPDGVLGGVIGGTGDVVPDYDQPPRVLIQPKVVYPPNAFIKKIEGVVHVRIIIDVDGRVRRAQIIRSIPALDNAALENVRLWVFVPAVKAGRPVATQHDVSVTFRIY